MMLVFLFGANEKEVFFLGLLLVVSINLPFPFSENGKEGKTL